MQKVSKQSLAMIALSILLAISIALTMTFAALSQSRTATGTITFSGGFSLTASGFASGDGSATTQTFNVTPSYGTDGNVSFDYASDSTNAQWVITPAASTAMYMNVTFSVQETTSTSLNVVTLAATEGTYGLTTNATTAVNIPLDKIITLASSISASSIDAAFPGDNATNAVTYTVSITVTVVDQVSLDENDLNDILA